MTDLGLGIIVSMKDAFSRNASRVQSAMGSLDETVADATERMSRNFDLIQKGTMMIGAGLALMALPAGLVASTADTQKALGELSSLGVRDLAAIEDAAESFTNTWSRSNKAQFIAAAYDVRSALSNLSDEAVGAFSSMAGLTAKATKASVEEMVGTFTAGYGIFKPIMRDMTDMEWAEAFSGGMAQTVASFKTTGAQMAEAIKNIGAVAAASNVPLEEQLAILGQLQTTMPGSEAGTLYKAFMMKAAEAGDKLGLSFIDSTGRLRGIVPILEEVATRFPDLSQARAQMTIKEAFGSDEAVKFLLQMSQGVASLEGNINAVQRAIRTGTVVTEEMARAMNMDIGSQFVLLRQQLGNLSEILGRTLIPVVTPVVQAISKVILAFQKLAKENPTLVRAVLTLSGALGSILTVVGGVMAAAGSIGLMIPLIKAGFVGIGGAVASAASAIAAYIFPVIVIIGGVVLALVLLKRAWESNFAGIRTTILGTWEKVRMVFDGIKSLVTSLTGGTGQMSAELAQRLEQAGLMGLVVTVFRVYYRVREFLVGMWNAFSGFFEKIRAIVEPAVRALVEAYMNLYKALFSVTRIFSRASTAADASSFRSLGETLGKVLGVIAQIGAYILSAIIQNLVRTITTATWVVRGFIWLGTAIVSTLINAAKFIYRFFLPVRILVQAFRMAGRVIYAVWRVLTGDLSVVGGLKAIGGAVFDCLTTPFRWAWDVVAGFWHLVTGFFTGIGRLIRGAMSMIFSAFLDMPVLRMVRGIFDAVRGFLSGDTTFFEAGKGVLMAFARGMWSVATYPWQMLRQALGWMRRLLPFSDAAEGPLSDLTASGASVLETLARGMMAVVGLPGRVLSQALGGLIDLGQGALSGISAMGRGIVSAFTWPFQQATEMPSFTWLGGAAVAAWNRIVATVSGAWARLVEIGRSALGWVSSPFTRMADAAFSAWERITDRASLFWDGLRSMAEKVTTWIRTPFEAIGRVMSGVAEARASLLGSLGRRLVVPSMATALSLTPVLAGEVPATGVPMEVPTRTIASEPSTTQRMLLAETRGAVVSGVPGERETDLRSLVEAILAKMDSLAERPIEISVTTQLDGRKIAQSVYKDLREQKIRNYETL